MIAKLKGRVDTLGDTWLILDVGGVGYHVSCSRMTLGSATVGEALTLHIETVLRQESLQLYGFLSENEQAMFRLLTTVQGVGMRMGMAILSALSPDEIASAIASQDKTTLTRADGVGPKLATRLVTELKDKVGGMAIPLVMKPSNAPSSSIAEEAISALVNLGYRRPEAQGAVLKIENPANLNDAIREALAYLARA